MDSYPVSLLERSHAVSGRTLWAGPCPASCSHKRSCERPVENRRGLEQNLRFYLLTDQLRCWLTVRFVIPPPRSKHSVPAVVMPGLFRHSRASLVNARPPCKSRPKGHLP